MLKPIARLLSTPPAVLALSFARMADALGNSMLIVVLPIFIARQPSAALESLPEELQVGLVISFYGVLFAVSQPFTGALSDRLGRRRPFVLTGLAIMAAATLGFMLAGSYLSIVVLRSLQGIGVALVVPSVLALITAATETETRGNAMGVYSTFRMIGFASGPLLGGLILVRLGFNTVFLVGGGFVLAALLLVLTTVDEPAPDHSVSDAQDSQNPAKAGDASPQTGSLMRRLPSPTILVLMFSSIVLASSLSMISSLENVFNERLSQTALGFGVAFSALTVSRLFVQIPLGRLSDNVGRKKVIVSGLLALVPITALFGHVGSTLQLILLRLLQGVATAGVAAPAFALAGDLAREGGEGQEMSYVTMGFGIGLASGPMVTGLLAGYLGFAVPFYVFASLAVVAALAVWRFAEESVGPSATVRRPPAPVIVLDED